MIRETHSIASIVFTLALFLCFFQSGMGQELVYKPKNPAFGGSSLNYQWLMSSANAQNLYNSSARSGYQRDPLADFEQSLQRQVLSELSRNLIRDKFGENMDLTKDNHFEFGEFTIDVMPGIDGVEVRIFNVLTGDETSIMVPNFNG